MEQGSTYPSVRFKGSLNESNLFKSSFLCKENAVLSFAKFRTTSETSLNFFDVHSENA